MAANKKLLVASVSALVLLVMITGALVYFSPHIAMWRLSSAIEARDTQAVMGYVDLPRFRESLRSEMKRVMREELEKNLDTSNPFAMLGAKIAEGAADYLVESVLTEESIVKILEGQRPSLDSKSDGASNGRNSRSEESSNSNETPTTESSDGDSSSVTTEIVRDSLGSFRVVYKKNGIHLFDLLWEGNGFTGWKVVGVQ